MISFGRDESDGSGFLEWIWVKAIPFFVEMGYVRIMYVPDGTLLMKTFLKKSAVI